MEQEQPMRIQTLALVDKVYEEQNGQYTVEIKAPPGSQTYELGFYETKLTRTSAELAQQVAAGQVYEVIVERTNPKASGKDLEKLYNWYWKLIGIAEPGDNVPSEAPSVTVQPSGGTEAPKQPGPTATPVPWEDHQVRTRTSIERQKALELAVTRHNEKDRLVGIGSDEESVLKTAKRFTYFLATGEDCGEELEPE